MRRFYKAKSGFTHLSDNKMLVLAHTVFAAMNNNTFFVAHYASVVELEQVMIDFQKKLARSGHYGSPLDTAIKNEARKDLMKIMKELAFYVNKIANGSLVILLSSGFKISHYRKRTNPPEKVIGLRLKDGRKAGQMVLTFQSQPNVRLYEYRYSKEIDESGEIAWTDEVQITTSSRNNLIAPVIPGQVYFLTARAINTRGVGDWSDPVHWMAR